MRTLRNAGHGEAVARARSLTKGDAIDRPGEVVRDEHGAVTQQREADRSADVLAVGIEPAFGEYLLLPGGAVAIHRREQDTSARGHRAVPGAMLRREDAAAVFLGERLAGVEHEPEIGCVRDCLDRR